MKVPNKIKISNYTYKVNEETDPELNGNKVWGSCVYKQQKIVIDKDATPERKQAILMHECIHACLEACDFDIGTLRPQDIEEYICTHLGTSLTNLLKDNPRLVKYLTHKEG